MAIINFNNISKQFSGEYILNELSFSIEPGEHAGLIGKNGAGKTTIMKMILGVEEPDVNISDSKKGSISIQKGLKIGYLSQNVELGGEDTLFDTVMGAFSEIEETHLKIEEINHCLPKLSGIELDKKMEELAKYMSKYEAMGGFTVEYKVKQALNGLGFKESDYMRKVSTFSGGEKNRAAKARMLVEEPDILLLDEPTNHLDAAACDWLEKYLTSYKGAFLVISHDRYFLDKVTNKTIEIEHKKTFSYSGNYTDFVVQKEIKKLGLVRQFEKEQEKIKETEEYIRRYRAGIKCRQARGRQKILNRMERMDNPIENIDKMKLRFETDREPVDLVLDCKNINKTFGSRKILNNIMFRVYRGERIGILGKNGIGKSTLLKVIAGKSERDTGEVEFGLRTKLGYYDQNHETLKFSNTALDEIMKSYPMSEEEARTWLGMFLLTGDDVFKRIETLSGGEKAKVALLKLAFEKPNLLIFDEPTNHLDIYSREVLEESLEDYDGTILVVSHDRYFLERTVDTIYELTEDGIFKFDGDYNAYVEKITKTAEKEGSSEKAERSLSYEEQKKIKNQIASLSKKYENAEKAIAKKEAERENLQKEYEKAGEHNDYKKLVELQNKMEEADMEILQAMEEWEEIHNKLEELNRI